MLLRSIGVLAVRKMIYLILSLTAGSTTASMRKKLVELIASPTTRLNNSQKVNSSQKIPCSSKYTPQVNSIPSRNNSAHALLHRRRRVTKRKKIIQKKKRKRRRRVGGEGGRAVTMRRWRRGGTVTLSN